MKPVYGEAPIIGYVVPRETLKLDYDLYDSLYKATGGGGTMTREQMARYLELKELFDPAE